VKTLHTPESRFADLKDYPFTSHYVNVKGLVMHYLDEGPINAKPVMLLHGVPTWSYLYRHMIKKIAEAGNRVIAPDLIGLGKSEKPCQAGDHTYQSHVDWISVFIDLLGLKGIVLFAHDWGSLIGLRIAAQQPELFSGLIVSNGMLPTGEYKMHLDFELWKFFTRYSPFLPVDLIIEQAITGGLDKEEMRAYRAPFPSSKFKIAIRALPGLVPVLLNDPESEANRMAWEVLGKWDKPFLTAFSTRDPVTRGGDEYLQKRIPGAKGQYHVRLDGGHFVQEDRSAELSDIIINFIHENRLESTV
jgi:haloalkane dehalogenase